MRNMRYQTGSPRTRTRNIGRSNLQVKPPSSRLLLCPHACRAMIPAELADVVPRQWGLEISFNFCILGCESAERNVKIPSLFLPVMCLSGLKHRRWRRLCSPYISSLTTFFKLLSQCTDQSRAVPVRAVTAGYEIDSRHIDI